MTCRHHAWRQVGFVSGVWSLTMKRNAGVYAALIFFYRWSARHYVIIKGLEDILGFDDLRTV